ncbi:MAG: sulfurtransferase [Aureispira sp.]
MTIINKTKLIIHLSFTMLLAACIHHSVEVLDTNNSKLLSCEQMLNILNHKTDGYTIIDIRKAVDYQKGHLPHAIRTWREDYEDNSHVTKGMMANKTQMETLLGTWGVSQQDTLVLYDGNGNSNACRLWWILSAYGYNKIKILDGSFKRWQLLQYPIDTLTPHHSKTSFQLQAMDYSNHANQEEVQQHILQQGQLLDSRTIEEYTGMLKKGNVKRGGHIPSAIRFDWSELVRIAQGADGTFKDLDLIKQKLQTLQIKPDNNIIVYCQSGVRSACITFVLKELLGYQKVKNYDGSWLEWGNSDWPIEVD